MREEIKDVRRNRIGYIDRQLNGKQDNITEDDYLIAAKSMNLPERKARGIIAEVRDAVNKWMDFAELAGVNEETAETKGIDMKDY